MRYIIELILFLIVLYASTRAKKQMEKAIVTKTYDFGIYYKIQPLSGEKAVRMATIGLTIAKASPWAMVGLIVIYNLLDWIR
jgi:hypothetical protein